MLDTVTFAVSAKSLDGWIVRLAERDVDVDGPFTRFSRPTIGFRDPDGLKLEIAAVDGLEPTDAARSDRDVAASIGGFGAVTLCVEAPERTIELLTETFGYRQVAEDSERRRLRAANAGDGTVGAELDVLCHPEAIHGRLGGGTVHHIAFRAQTDEEQHVWREKIVALGFNVTPVLDRQYFRSIYFREPGGILFEIATDPPGFAVDEEADCLGTSLKLPPWLEPKRADIERRLPPVRLPGAGS
jgi:glyoxalase family protein